MSSYSGRHSRRDDSMSGVDSAGLPMEDHWITATTDMTNRSESEEKKERRGPHPVVVLGVVTDLLVLVAVVVLEYFLRWTNLFAYRKQAFSCNDPNILYKKEDISCDYFAIQGETQWLIILLAGFCLPPMVILPCELVIWRLNRKKCKEYKLNMCGKFDVPQVSRRIIRIIVTFAFGAFSTLVIVDVIKIMVGKLRPRFIELCDVQGGCTATIKLTAAMCQAPQDRVRWASTSFPSIHTALTSFCAIYLSVYLHGILRWHGKSVSMACLCLLLWMGTVLTGWSQVCQYDNDVTDVVVGAAIGGLVALYLSIIVLQGFEFRERVSNRKLNKKLNLLLLQASKPTRENRSLRKHDRYPYFGDSSQNLSGSTPQIPQMPTFYGNGIPRPLVTRPVPGASNSNQLGPRDMDLRQNTFQRDLQKTIDQYRRAGSPNEWSQHM